MDKISNIFVYYKKVNRDDDDDKVVLSFCLLNEISGKPIANWKSLKVLEIFEMQY